MMVAERLRALREQKGLSQGDIERRTGLACTYISRVENGYLTPSVNTLEKWAHALKVPLYALFYDGEAPPKPILQPESIQPEESQKNARFLTRLCRTLAHIDERHLQLLLQVARRMAYRKRPIPK
jgi:transcriptional regulator with XRE-family HTH domain